MKIKDEFEYEEKFAVMRVIVNNQDVLVTQRCILYGNATLATARRAVLRNLTPKFNQAPIWIGWVDSCQNSLPQETMKFNN